MVFLLDSQNPDGGWPYQRGGLSWTEPTAYALLAVMATGSISEPVARGIAWLRAAQLPDGGWPPEPAIRHSTWVTAVAALLGPAALGHDAHQRGIRWLLRGAGQDTNFPSRVRQFLMGNAPRAPGWPWFPETSAWVAPTALSMLALHKAARSAQSFEIGTRLATGASYLFEHACAGGGWNYGAARVLDYDARPYPETTGLALLALVGRDSPAVRKACAWARAQLSACRASEGESWLRLGLLAHGQLPPDTPAPARPPRTVQNMALAQLASVAIAGRNPFLE